MKDKVKGAVKQIGAKIDATLWKQIRMLALEKNTTATELMNRAMSELIARERRGKKK